MHRERENKPRVQCLSWSVLFIFHGVATLLTVVRYNSSATIKHARNLPRHMLLFHGHCKGHFLRVSIYPSLFMLGPLDAGGVQPLHRSMQKGVKQPSHPPCVLNIVIDFSGLDTGSCCRTEYISKAPLDLDTGASLLVHQGCPDGEEPGKTSINV